MTTQRCAHAAAFVLAATLFAAVPQQIPPTRDLGATIATSTYEFQKPVFVRALPNGSVLVAEPARRRVVFLDSTLTQLSVVVDSMTSSVSSSLIPFGRDSTLFVDLASLALLVLDDHGKIARAISVPKTSDIALVAAAIANGTPVVDAQGRLIYRANFARIPGATPLGPAVAAAIAPMPDSAPLVRADFASRTIDTIAVISAVQYFKTKAAALDSTQRRLIMKDQYNPLATSDDWVGLSDGSIAIVRAHDYHVDFVDAGGTTRATPPLPYKWKRLSDADKQQMVDSMRPVLAVVAERTLAAGVAMQTVYGLKRLARQIDLAPLTEIPDYEPPFVRGTSHADLDGHVWILPRVSALMTAGYSYDVVDRNGQLTERVHLPAGRILAGFGPAGIAFVTNTTGATTPLEAKRVR